MKEISEIIKSYQNALSDGRKTALATVVKVVGSSYRSPGARMLITEDGQLTGAISGGCLEGDALRKALSAIRQQENKLVSYDSTDEDDAKFGVQLGCNGIVYILFEPIINSDPLNPIELLKMQQQKREPAVLVSIFSMTDKTQTGTVMLFRKDMLHSQVPHGLMERTSRDAATVLEAKKTDLKNYHHEGNAFDVFLDFVAPPIAVIIAGAGNDVQPLAEICSFLGWQVTVADGRQTHATRARFPKADHIIVSKPDSLLEQLTVDQQTAVLLMTHNYNYDLALLGELLKIEVCYIGILGPKTKMHRMLSELGAGGTDCLPQLYGPVGLDIGAETSEEIALSVVSEIKAVFSRRQGEVLRSRKETIHSC